MGSDYRTSILYAAISIEAAAATLLDEEYERLIAAVPTPSAVRVIDLPQAGGAHRRIDPVYAHLTRGGGQFRTLLHELPLYIFGRSLMVQNQALYDGALRLYTTRNAIAHRGEPDDEHRALSLDRAGSIAQRSGPRPMV